MPYSGQIRKTHEYEPQEKPKQRKLFGFLCAASLKIYISHLIIMHYSMVLRSAESLGLLKGACHL